MIHQFEQLENGIKRLEIVTESLKRDKEQLQREVQELRGIIEDRDLEIMQLQEEVQKATQSAVFEKKDIENRLEGLLGRVRSMAPEENDGGGQA